MFSEIFAATVQPFIDLETGEVKTDSNTKETVILRPFAGKYPSKRTVIAGTIAENAGFVPGERYLVQCVETEPSEEYGRQFEFTNLGEMSITDVVSSMKSLGKVTKVDVTNQQEDPVDEPIED